MPPPRPIGVRAAASLGVLAALVGCLSAGPGACSPREAAYYREIGHVDGLELTPQDHPWGICTTTYETDADAEEVIAHYEAQWRDAGWSVDPVVPPPTDVPPPPTAGLRPGEQIVNEPPSWYAIARKDRIQYSVEVYEGAGATHVTILAGDPGGG